MTIITCPIDGTWLVRPDGPLPLGQSESSFSTAVHRHDVNRYPMRVRWSCEEHGGSCGTTSGDCWHIKAVKDKLLEDARCPACKSTSSHAYDCPYYPKMY